MGFCPGGRVRDSQNTVTGEGQSLTVTRVTLYIIMSAIGICRYVASVLGLGQWARLSGGSGICDSWG